MQMRVGRLREALMLLQPVIPKKTTLDALKNVLLKDGEASATNLEVTVTLALPEVVDGECLIPHHTVLDLLKYVPGDEMLTIEPEDKKIHLSWKSGKADYDVAEVADYPTLPGIKPRATGAVDGDILVKALTSVVGYCATETERPVLNCVMLALGEDGSEVATADGFRLAVLPLPISFPAAETVLIPSTAVPVLESLWQKSPPTMPLADSLVSQLLGKREMELSLNEGNPLICAKFGRVTFFSQLTTGTFPNYKQLIPTEAPMKVTFFAEELNRAVRGLRGIAEATKGIVRFMWNDDTMAISAKGDEKGSVEAEVQVKTVGGPGKIALNAGYMLSYLRGKEGVITMGVSTRESPVTLRYGTGPLVIMMPMHTQWPGEAPAAEVQVEEPVEPEVEPEELEAEVAEVEPAEEPVDPEVVEPVE